MRNRLIISISLFLSALLSISGCVSKHPGYTLPDTDNNVFYAHLETLQARYDLTSSLKTTQMNVTIQEANRDPEELRELLWYKKSEDGADLLHIQALGGFNDTRGIAIANRDKFLLVLVDEQKGYLGELSDGILRKLFGIDLRVSDVLSAIFANPFLDRRTDKIKFEDSGNKYIVSRPGVDSDHTETITLLVKENEPRVTEWHIIDGEGNLQQKAFFSDYRQVDGILRPHKVEIERPPEQTKIIVKIGQVQLNTEIKDSKFDFAPFMEGDIEILPFSKLDERDES